MRQSDGTHPMYVTGVDIVEIGRIRRAVAHWNGRFTGRVYTPAELRVCRGRIPELAARFAGKEAVMKALGTGVRGVGWRDIEILSLPSGKPQVHLNGRARHKAQALGLDGLEISLSHSREYAIASVVGGTS